MDQDMFSLDICSMGTGREIPVFCCCCADFSIAVDEILLVDSVKFFCILVDFLFRSSISCWEKGIQVSGYNCDFFFSLFQFYWLLLHVFHISVVYVYVLCELLSHI